MKKNIHENSREAYKKVKKDIIVRKQKVLMLIKRFPRKPTAWYADKMKVYPNVISGRFGEYRDAGVIKAVGKVKYNSTRLMNIWEAIA
jgi:hypothetical protein